MEPEQLNMLVTFFKTLADENRLRIIALLSESEYSVNDLADLLALKPPTVSHHLSKLQALDLVHMEKDGTTHRYKLNAETLHRLNSELITSTEVAALAADTLDQNDEKILRNYLDGERLKTIPGQYKKKLIILRWLASHFEPARDYPETEVNAILKRHHDDYATLRREFIINKFMERDHGIYRRLPAEVTEAHITHLLNS